MTIPLARDRLAGLAVAALFGTLACNRIELAPGALGPPAPNVLLLTIDTLRADHVGAYGARFAETPTLDRIAADGVRFENAISSSPLTLPSHASILTGLYPPQTGVRHNGLYRLDTEIETLAERLQSEGYATAAFVGAYVLAERFGLDQGFSIYDDETLAEAAGPGSFLERKADAVTDRALAWVATAKPPWFAWVHYYDPHAHHAPPPPYAERFASRPYDGEIAFVDAQLARLLAGSAPERQPTLVVVTADHGESLGEHQEVDHGYTVYDAVLRVPLILRGPGVPTGRVVTELARSVDVAPTVLTQLGLDPLSGAAGADLAPLWRGGEAARRVAYAETLATQIDFGWSPLFALRTQDHLYVRAPRPELYDLVADPRQLANLLEDATPEARARAAEFDSRAEDVLAGARTAAPERLDEQALEPLRALGYALPSEPVAQSGLDPKDGLLALPALWAATRAYAKDDLARAEQLLLRFLAEMPTSSRGHELLAAVYVSTRRLPEAVFHLEAAARLVSGSARTQAMLGELYLELGRTRDAETAFRSAISLDPGEPRAQLGLAWEEARRGDLEAAARHARIALEHDPHDALVRIRIGTIFAGVGAHEDALAAFEDASRVDPRSKHAHMLVAIAAARLGRAAVSDAALTRAGEVAADPGLLGRLGLAHAAAGDLPRAERVLAELRERDAPKAAVARLEQALAGDARADGSGS